MNDLIIIKTGDSVTINGKTLYYAGIDPEMKYKNLPCVFLATDLNNKNTYSRFSNDYLMQRGYSCMMKIKYTHMLYNRANPFGKKETHITTGAPVARPEYMPGNSDTIFLKKDNYIFFVEPENIIKVYNA